MKIIIEYDNQKLKNISDKLSNLFLDNNYNVILLDSNMSQQEKSNIIDYSSHF